MGLNLMVTGNTAEPEGGREQCPAEVPWEYIEQVIMLQMKVYNPGFVWTGKIEAKSNLKMYWTTINCMLRVARKRHSCRLPGHYMFTAKNPI